MDKYVKWIIVLVFLLVISVVSIVYFGFYYDFNKNDNVGNKTLLSPEIKEKNETNKSVEREGLIENKDFGNFEKDFPVTEKDKDNFERPYNSPGNENNETNKTGYWIQDLPDSGGGTYAITPLIIYEKLGKGKKILLYMLLFIGLVIYIIMKVAKNDRKRINKEDIEIPSNSVTLQSGISNRHSRTKGDTINGNVYKEKNKLNNKAKDDKFY